MAEPKWQVADSDALNWHDLDDGCLVFHRLTGETHFFNLYATFILRTLQETPQTFDDLCHHIAHQLGEDDDASFVEKITKQLNNFEAMAIVQAGPP